MNWWLSQGNDPEGPFPAEHVAEWLRTGQILPGTLACPEGGQEWKCLSTIDEFVQFVPQRPSRESPPPLPRTGLPRVGPFRAGRRAQFGILTAAIVLTAGLLAFELLLIGDPGAEFTPLQGLGFCVAAAAAATWAVFHYRLWSLLPHPLAETTPGKAVGYLFIPFFNCYWVFRSYLGVNRGLNRLADAHGLPAPRANMGLATAAAVFFVAGWLFALGSMTLPDFQNIESQYVIRDQYDLAAAYEDVAAAHAGWNVLGLLLVSAPSFVIWLLMVLNQKRMVEHLLENNVPMNTASRLVVQ